ncbi:MAG: RuBisCO large subunit C-terminal-like domain-containing protein [Acidimicrobiales bacterium]
MIRATYELEPDGSAATVVEVAAAGRASVVDEVGGRAVIDFPEDNWGANLPLILSSVVAGEAGEIGSFTRCRLVGLDLPAGLLPGPAFAAPPTVAVGAIVKPSLGLAPADVAEVVAAAARGGATVVKDDELLGDPVWCPLDDRVRAVAARLPAGVTYCANVTGPMETLVDRARRVVELGATGVMVNAFTSGLDSVRALRQAGLGVPVLAHRAGSGPWTRNTAFGVSGAVVAGLTRQAGADFVLVGAFGGSMFDTDDEVAAQLQAVRRPLHGTAPAVAVLGGGVGPHNAAAQRVAAGGTGLLVLVGSAAYGHPGGVEAAVAATVATVGGR